MGAFLCRIAWLTAMLFLALPPRSAAGQVASPVALRLPLEAPGWPAAAMAEPQLQRTTRNVVPAPTGPAFDAWPIVQGAILGALIGAAVSGAASYGACEARTCSIGQDVRGGALIGGSIGAAFGVLVSIRRYREAQTE